MKGKIAGGTIENTCKVVLIPLQGGTSFMSLFVSCLGVYFFVPCCSDNNAKENKFSRKYMSCGINKHFANLFEHL